MLSGRWHDTHFSWKIGATSLVNVTAWGESAAAAGIDDTRRALQASAIDTRTITGSFRTSAEAGPSRPRPPDQSLVSDIIRGPNARPNVSVRLFTAVRLWGSTFDPSARCFDLPALPPVALQPFSSALSPVLPSRPARSG